LRIRKSRTRQGIHFDFLLYLRRCGITVPVGIFVPFARTIDDHLLHTSSSVCDVGRVMFNPSFSAELVSIELLKETPNNNQIANLFITIKDAGRYNLEINDCYMKALLGLVKQNLTDVYGTREIGYEFVEHIDRYEVPHTLRKDLLAWRTRSWDMLIEYSVLEVLFPETLGRLKGERLEEARAYFINNGSFGGLIDHFAN